MAKNKKKGAKRKFHHSDDPRRIFAEIDFVKKMEKTEYTATYTGNTTTLLNVLRFNEKWSYAAIGRLMEAIENGLAKKETLDFAEMNKRLKEVTGLEITWGRHKPTDNVYDRRKNPYKWEMEERLLISEDYKNEYSAHYFSIVYDYLISIGFGSKRINRINDEVIKLQNLYRQDHEESIFNGLKARLEADGIFVEMPEF